ncbi:hypothetical protein GF342_03270 [Candidatus Woesearchaeota archaeon]|nr:hypothetical protein [Candidatus Woesearchaeota archaeon]
MDHLINLGDLISCDTKEQMDLLWKKVNILFDKRMHHIFGNHDLDHLTLDELKTLSGQEEKQVFFTPGFRHIIVSAYRNTTGIDVAPDTLSWLTSQLNNKGERVIVYMHYPISEDPDNLSYYHKNHPERAFVRQAAQLRQLLSTSNCSAFINGHTHFPFDKKINGLRHITVPSFAEDDKGVPMAAAGILELTNATIKYHLLSFR